MNISRIDLNLLVYLDVLLRERNVTKAAEQLGITQPAMSNGLKRLRNLFDDPLLVRSSEGMRPTERALGLQPQLQQMMLELQHIMQPKQEFNPFGSDRVFRIMASDYSEATLLPEVVKLVRREAPSVILDCLTPSDGSFKDMEQGRVDLAITRFDDLPLSFHSATIWQDQFLCLVHPGNPVLEQWNLKNYLSAKHMWVSKTGVGTGVGMTPDRQQEVGWVDQALSRIGQKREVAIFTRHYQMSATLTKNNDLIATIPARIAQLQAQQAELAVREPPFYIPSMELKMAWSPLMQHDPGHRWLRRLIVHVAEPLRTGFSDG